VLPIAKIKMKGMIMKNRYILIGFMAPIGICLSTQAMDEQKIIEATHQMVNPPYETMFAERKVYEDKTPQLVSNGCPFCTQFQANCDDKHFILRRFSHCVAMLNRFPYNRGHILILPHDHKASLKELHQEARSELMEVVTCAIDLLHKELKTEGFNFGCSLGTEWAGASIPGHLHFHVLPRFSNDTSFLPLLAGTRIVSPSLSEMYAILKEQFAQIKLGEQNSEEKK
jgi:ATP adenylyltransferase